VPGQELADRVVPILGFLLCITVVAELADRIGVFAVVADKAVPGCSLGGGRCPTDRLYYAGLPEGGAGGSRAMAEVPMSQAEAE